MDTIFALATAPGKAGVSVMRISGPDALHALRVFGVTIPVDGRGLRRLVVDGEAIDEALCLHFAQGRSFTGETVVELHLHGSVAVLARVSSELAKAGLRPAEAGEFSRRAFDNGRLDLAQVEGLADLIDSETEAQRRQAVRALSGDLGKKAASWKQDLQSVAAVFAAGFDFSDEDIPQDILDDAADRVDAVIAALDEELVAGKTAERIRDGFDIVILGAPNTGKSTLLNRLAGRDAAITSTIAGTTRDVIEVRMDIGGFPVTLVDTAGLRDTDDEIESIGIERARARADAADLRVILAQDSHAEGFGEDDRTLIRRAKADHGGGVSGLTGAGIDSLIDDIRKRLLKMGANPGSAVRQRHRLAISASRDDLEMALDLLRSGGDEVIASDLVLSGIRKLDALIGRVDVESVLGEIFSRFCIGK